MTQARQRPKSFVPQVSQLFQTMATGGYFGADEISYFDGRLFDAAEVFDLDTDGLDILRRVSELDWASIEPSIFGTLFVRSLDPSKRSQLGAQYTSKEDILLILEPVLMTPLRRKWAADSTASPRPGRATHSGHGRQAHQTRQTVARSLDWLCDRTRHHLGA